MALILFWNTMYRKAVYIIISFVITFSNLHGQKLINSPYARFNIGILNPQGTLRSLGMGGISTAMRDNNTISFSNPASYTSFDTTSFVFDMGMDLSRLKLLNGNASFSSTDMNFRHLLLGFPVSKRIDIAAGLIPFSNGYYYIAEKITKGQPGWNETTGDYSTQHKGSGSITSLFAGAGVKITKNISLGINITTLFGKLTRLNQYEFAESTTSFNQNSVESFSITGFNADFGAQYTATIKKDYFINAGISYTPQKNYKSTHEFFKERYTIYRYPPYSPDTLANYGSTTTDSTRLPDVLKLGILFGKKDKIAFGIDYVISGWNNARIHGSDAPMANTRTLMAGLEYIPDKYSNTNFLKRIEYRLGGRISDNYLVLNGVQLKEYSATAGFAIRLKNSYSKATFYFDYTRRQGDLSKGLHNEDIFSVGASLNLYDFWFIKRKYE